MQRSLCWEERDSFFIFSISLYLFSVKMSLQNNRIHVGIVGGGEPLKMKHDTHGWYTPCDRRSKITWGRKDSNSLTEGISLEKSWQRGESLSRNNLRQCLSHLFVLVLQHAFVILTNNTKQESGTAHTTANAIIQHWSTHTGQCTITDGPWNSRFLLSDPKLHCVRGVISLHGQIPQLWLTNSRPVDR